MLANADPCLIECLVNLASRKIISHGARSRTRDTDFSCPPDER